MKKSEPGSVELKKFIAGGLAGCCAKGVVSPLDRIKIFRQGTFFSKNLKISDFLQASIVSMATCQSLERVRPLLETRAYLNCGVVYQVW